MARTAATGPSIALAYLAPVAQRTTLLKELEFFVKMTNVEQECQMKGELPSVEDYKWRRMGSSAVRVCLAISEYMRFHLT